MKCTAVILLLLVLAHGAWAQDKVIVRFADAGTNDPVYNVSVLDHTGALLANSDSAGYCALPFGMPASGSYLLATHAGYATDTVRILQTTIYLQPLAVTLGATIIRSSKVSCLLRDPDEYVADYMPDGDRIIMATHSGNNGGRAKLIVINRDGEELGRCRLPAEPLGLFRSCAGTCYCVCASVFYPVTFRGAVPALLPAYNIRLLPGLQQCEQLIDGNHFYRLRDRTSFRMSYGMMASGSNEFRPMLQFEEKDVALASFLEKSMADNSYDEYEDMKRLWDEGHYRESYRLNLLRRLWDDGSYAHINIPLYSSGDSLVIFDYFHKRILFYSSMGRPAGQAPVQFTWKASQQFRIIKDDAANRFYLHRYDNPAHQTIEALDVHTGLASGSIIAIVHGFAEDVKIDHGDIYYLWHNSGATRRLYVQHEDMSSTVAK